MIATPSQRSGSRRPALSAGSTHRLPPAAPETTLLVFTLGARGDGRRKRLLPAALRDRETALYRACLDEALAAGRGAGCRLEVCSPAGVELPADARAVGQAGSGFGERLARAFDAALSRTAGPVVAVGTDTPGLARDHVERALERLRQAPRDPGSAPGAPRGRGDDAGRDRVVIGPSPDGGLYLLASTRPLGDLLRRVRWCRRSTLAHLRRLLRRAGLSVVLLEPLADLDRRRDLERWVARHRRHRGGPDDRPTERAALAIGRALSALRRPFRPMALGRPSRTPAPVRRGRAPPASLPA